MKLIYALLAVLGTIIPLYQFIPWLAENGLNIPLLFQQAFGSEIAAFAWFDVLISAITRHAGVNEMG